MLVEAITVFLISNSNNVQKLPTVIRAQHIVSLYPSPENNCNIKVSTNDIWVANDSCERIIAKLGWNVK